MTPVLKTLGDPGPGLQGCSIFSISNTLRMVHDMAIVTIEH